MPRFSQLYLTRGEPTQDNTRFRNRLAAYISSELNDWRSLIGQEIETEIGSRVPRNAAGPSPATFFREAEIRDVLDAITIIWQIVSRLAPHKASPWKGFVTRVLQEENLDYRIDASAVVHYMVDVRFEMERTEALRWITDTRFSAVKLEFEKSYSKLSESTPDTKASVRAIFEALEILAKLFDGGIARLGRAEVTRSIKPKIELMYRNDAVALDSANQNLAAFSNWINSVQIYRHGQAVTEPAPPPLGLAVLIVAQGTAFLRWLLEVYQFGEVAE